MKACLWQKPSMPSNDSLAKPSPSSKSSIQEYYTPIYLPPAAPPTNHITPAPFLRNLSQQPTINYHPTQILQQQQRQHVPLNYNVNMLPHQPTMPTALPFATNPHITSIETYDKLLKPNGIIKQISFFFSILFFQQAFGIYHPQ